MKKLLFIALLASYAQFASAQGAWDILQDIKAHDRGQINFQLGYGVPPAIDNEYFSKFQGEVNYKLNYSGPVYARLEVGLNRKFSFALGATYTNWRANWDRNRVDTSTAALVPYRFGTDANQIVAMGQLYYHMYVNPRWDVYVTGGMGYQIFNHKDYTTYNQEAGTFTTFFKEPYWPAYTGGIGFRHYFLTRTAIYAEAGYGKSYGQVGFIVKLIQPKKNRIY
jgi:hypothetical protein